MSKKIYYNCYLYLVSFTHRNGIFPISHITQRNIPCFYKSTNLELLPSSPEHGPVPPDLVC